MQASRGLSVNRRHFVAAVASVATVVGLDVVRGRWVTPAEVPVAPSFEHVLPLGGQLLIDPASRAKDATAADNTAFVTPAAASAEGIGAQVEATATAWDSYQRGARDARKARLEVKARGGVPQAPEKAPAADEHPYIRGSHDEAVAEDWGATVIWDGP